MKISRDVAIAVLKHLYKHHKCSFPFLVMCKEYSQEDDDFVEVQPNEWKNIKNDKIYQTFEIREDLQQNKHKLKNKSKAKNLIRKITIKCIFKEILGMAKECGKFYQRKFIENTNATAHGENEFIEEYGENEYFGGKAEAYYNVLFLIKKYKI